MKEIKAFAALLILAILTFIILILGLSLASIIMYPRQSQSTYKVYYEYNIINNDTIPVDTIYVPLNH